MRTPPKSIRPRLLALLTAALATFLVLPGCKQSETTAEKVEDSVNDALDRRPNEGVRDAVEDAEKAVEDAEKAVEDAAEEVGDAVKEAADEVKDAVKKATDK